MPIAYCIFPTPTIMTFIANATLREQQALNKMAGFITLSQPENKSSNQIYILNTLADASTNMLLNFLFASL